MPPRPVYPIYVDPDTGQLIKLAIPSTRQTEFTVATNIGGFHSTTYTVVAKNSNYTVRAQDSGTLFTTDGSSDPIIFTLPTTTPALTYAFVLTAGGSIQITPPAGSTITLPASPSANTTITMLTSASVATGGSGYGNLTNFDVTVVGGTTFQGNTGTVNVSTNAGGVVIGCNYAFGAYTAIPASPNTVTGNDGSDIGVGLTLNLTFTPGYITSSTQYSYIVLTAISTTNWEATYYSGVWTTNATQATTGLTLPPPNTPYQQWTSTQYSAADITTLDYFTGTSLNTTLWNPWLGGDFFGDPVGTRFVGQPPNSLTSDSQFSSWTLWGLSYPYDFNADIYDTYPAGGGSNLTGNHLITGPGTAYAGGGLSMNAMTSFYPAYTLGLADVFALSVSITNTSNQVTFNYPNPYSFTLTTSATTAPGSTVLTFASVPVDQMYVGLQVTDLTNPSTDFINIIGGQKIAGITVGVQSCVASWTSTTVTLTVPTGSSGVPSGDTIQFQTALLSEWGEGVRYYIIGPNIPAHTSFQYENILVLDWTTVSDTGTQDWVAAAGSTTLSTMVAAVNGGNLWVSTNTGSTWTSVATSQAWNSVCCSSDGTIMYATVTNGLMYTSTNSGSTWSQVTTIFGGETAAFQQVCCSSDGTIVYVTLDGFVTSMSANLQAIYQSTNSGSTWASVNNTAVDWLPIACSSNGEIVLAGAQAGSLYVSTNSGASWTAVYAGVHPPTFWNSVFVTPDGTHMIAVENGGFIDNSEQSGATNTWIWQFWDAISGQRKAACQDSTGKYVLQATSTTDSTVYCSLNFGGQDPVSDATTYLPIQGLPTGAWQAFLCSADFNAFAVFDSGGGSGGNIYVSSGEFPSPRFTMSAAATATNTAEIVNVSRFGWVSASITGNEFRWSGDGGFWQYRQKYPQLLYGADCGNAFYPATSDPTGLSDWSLETGYTEFSNTLNANHQVNLGFFDLTTTGYVSAADLTLDYHTWGMEYWPEIAFTLYLDGAFVWSSSAAVFTGSISGSTLTITGSPQAINSGTVSQYRWLRYVGSSQTLYLHTQLSSNTWTIYDLVTGLPVSLSVGQTVMAVSWQVNYVFTTTTVAGSNYVTGISSTSNLGLGWSVQGIGIPPGTTIANVPVDGTDLYLTNPCTVSGTNPLFYYQPNWNMRGENVPILLSMVFTNCVGFHTISDFVNQPGPFNFVITGTEMYSLPR